MPKKSAVWSNVLPTKQTGLTTVIRRFEEISAAKLLKTRDEITGKNKTKQNKTKARGELLASLIPAKLAQFDKRCDDYFACESRDKSRTSTIETRMVVS